MRGSRCGTTPSVGAAAVLLRGPPEQQLLLLLQLMVVMVVPHSSRYRTWQGRVGVCGWLVAQGALACPVPTDSLLWQTHLFGYLLGYLLGHIPGASVCATDAAHGVVLCSCSDHKK